MGDDDGGGSDNSQDWGRERRDKKEEKKRKKKKGCDRPEKNTDKDWGTHSYNKLARMQSTRTVFLIFLRLCLCQSLH